MTPDEIHEQARQFVQWRAKRFDADFDVWNASKDMDDADTARIRSEARKLLAINEGTVGTDDGDEITRHLP